MPGRLCRFLLLAAAIYTAGLIARPYARPPHIAAVRMLCETCLGRFGPEGRIYCPPRLNQRGEEGLLLENTRTRATTGWVMNWDKLAYIPAVTVAALILASPIPWRRRVVALLAGMLLVHGWIVFRAALRAYLAFTANGELAQFQPGSWTSRGVEFVDDSVIRVLDWHAVPILIWILVTFRRGDLRRLMDLPDEPSTNANGAAGATHGGRGAADALEGGRGGRNRHARAKRRAETQSRPTAT